MSIALPQTFRRFITNVPLRWVLTVPFVLSTVGTTALVGYLSYRNGQAAVEDLGHRLVAETNERVTQELKTYLQTPLLINRLNVDAVEQEQLDLQNIPALEAALFNRLQQFDQVSAILFADPQGTFRVVEQLPDAYLGVADPSDPDKILSYRLDSQGKRQQLVYINDELDVRRDRPWYKRAVTTGKPGWNPVFQYGSFKALTSNASQPVYDRTRKRLLGVFAVHIRLDYLSQFLHELDISRAGRVIITDQSGALIAASTREQLYKFRDGKEYHQQFQQLKIDESQDDLTRSLGEYWRSRSDTLESLDHPQDLNFRHNGELQYVKITPFQDQYGLKWQIVTVIPRSHFLAAIHHNARQTVLLCLLTLGVVLTLGLLAANHLTARLAQLNRVSRELTAGNLDQRLPTDNSISELNNLAQMFNQMADQLQQSFARIKTALAESEEKFTIIFHSSPDPIALATLAEGRYVEANQSFLDLLDYSHQELTGQRFVDLGVWVDLEERFSFRQALLQQGYVRNLEVQLNTRTGQIKTVLISAERIEINGEAYVLSIVRDISDRKTTELALQQSETRYRAIVEDQTELIVRFLPDTTLLFVNDAYCRYFSISQEEVIGKSYRPIIYEADQARVAQLLQSMSADNPTVTIENRLIANGEIRWTQWVNRMLFDQQGNFTEIQSVGRDITQLKRIEEALRKSEANLLQAQRIAQVGSWEYDLTTEKITWSEELFRIFGLDPTRSELSYAEVLEMLPVEDRGVLTLAVQQAIADGSFYEVEHRICYPDGTIHFVISKGQVVFNDQQRVFKLYGAVSDITERKRAEAALQESETRFRQLAETVQEGFFVFETASAHYSYVNPAYATVLGIPLQSVYDGMFHWLNHIHPDDQDRIEAGLQRERQGEDFDQEYRFICPNGELRWLRSKAFPLQDETGTVVRVVGTVENITDRKRAEAKIQQLNQQLTHRINELQTLFEVLPIGVAIGEDSECRIARTNPRLSELLRVPLDTNASQNAPERPAYRVYKDGQEASAENLPMQYAAAHNIEVRDEEFEIVHPDGTVIQLLCYAAPLQDEQGKVRGVIGGFVDITERKRIEDERKRAEVALRESEERFRQIAENINQLFFVRSADSEQFLYISPAYEKIWGRTCESLYQDPGSWLAAIHPDDRASVLHSIKNQSQRSFIQREYRIIRPDGEIRWIFAEIFLMVDEAGHPLRYNGFAEDVTERKQLEQSLRSQAEKERLLTTITQNIRQSLDLEQILSTTVVEVQQALNADRALIFRLNQDGSGQVIQEAVVPDYPVTDQMRWEDECFSEACYRYYQQGIPRIVLDVVTDEWAGCLVEFMQAVGVKSKVVAPIVQANGEASAKVWGLLIVHACSHYRQWQETEADFLQQICNQLAIAIDQANLYQQLQIELAERRQAEKTLQEREAMLRAIGDNLPKGFVYQRVYEPDKDCFYYSYVSAGVERLLGIKPEILLENSQVIRSVGFADELADADKAVQESLKNLTPVELQMRNRTATGEIQWSSIRSTPRRLEDGRTVWDGVEADITDLKQTEAALRDSEELFRGAFDHAPIGISLVSTIGQFVKVNPYYCELLGYTEAELLTRTFQEITHPDDLELDLEGFQQMMAGEIRSFQIEKRYITKQGTFIPVLINAALVRGHNEQPLYCVGQVQDIRDRLKVERMKDEFVSIVSHELRTPLTSIRGALGILGSGIFDDRPQKAQHMLEIAINNSDRLVRLVDDILSLERLESGKVQLVMEHCQAKDLMQQAIDSVQAIADQSNITLSLTSLSATLWAAPDAIIQTLTNLLSNAIKFSSTGDTVWLRAKIENRETLSDTSTPSILFSITDQGRGIPQDKLAIIFERFQQVDVSDSRKKGGTGLGLAICRNIVQQHGGRISAESSVGKGSTFYVALPLTVEEKKNSEGY